MAPLIATLSWHEVAIASQVGIRRHLAALVANRANGYGRGDDDGWSDHIEGVCGELAVAKALGVYWTPTVDTFKSGGDVGDWQVRTRRRADYELLIRDDDADEAPFILVRGRVPLFEVVGWIRGRDGKRDEWRHAHGGRPPAYFVPAEALLPLETLPPCRC